MINRKLNQIILALLVIGALVTFWTGETVRSFRERNAAAETKVEPAAGPSVNVRKRSSGKYEEFRRKFRETEETLDRLQSGRPGDERYVTRKNQAVSELRYWETQLNSLYSCIMAALPQNEAETLAREQQDWRRKRDEKASAAARATASDRAPSTRECRRKPRKTGPTNCWSGTRTEYDPGQEILEKISRLCYSERQCFLLRSKQ